MEFRLECEVVRRSGYQLPMQAQSGRQREIDYPKLEKVALKSAIDTGVSFYGR